MKKTNNTMEGKSFKNAKIMIPMYGWPIDIYYGKPSEVKDHMADKFGVIFDTFDDYCNGYTSLMEKHGKKHKEINMFFFVNSNETPYSEKTVHTIHHEAIHTAWFILDYCGVKIDADNHEALTYLEGYIASKVYDQIEKWKNK